MVFFRKFRNIKSHQSLKILSNRNPTKLPKAKETAKQLKEEYDQMNTEVKMEMDQKHAKEMRRFDTVLEGVCGIILIF